MIAVALAALVPGHATATPVRLELTGALTSQRIVAFGTVTPPRPGGTVMVKLLVQRDGSFEGQARRFVDLVGRTDSDGDGRRDSTFETAFRAPEAATCRLVAVYRDPSSEAPARSNVTMPCARPDFGDGTATMSTDASTRSIEVEVADTPELRGFGLMYKRHLAAGRGMAFVFEADTSGGFWMKNTLIPLSIAFYDAAGTIVRILDMEPCEADPCPIYDPEATYRGALEVNQGAFEGWGVEEGDTIVVVPEPEP